MTRLLTLLLVTSLFVLAQWSCANNKHIMPREKSIDLHTNYTSRWIDVQGVNIHYRIEGEGPTLLLIHGLGASLHEWDAWANLMKNNYQVIRMDLPGFGLTGAIDTSQTLSVEYYTNFLHKFLDKIGVEKCHVAGNSLGGWLTWEYAVAHPNIVNKIVLVDPAGYVTPENMTKDIKRAQKPIVKQMLYKGMPKWLVKIAMNRMFGKSKPDKYEVERAYQLMNTEGNGPFMHRMVTTPFWPDTSLIKQVQAPTLIMWGDMDKVIKVDDAYKFERDIKGSKLIIYKGVGHSPNMEVPEKSAQDLRKFLQGK